MRDFLSLDLIEFQLKVQKTRTSRLNDSFNPNPYTFYIDTIAKFGDFQYSECFISYENESLEEFKSGRLFQEFKHKAKTNIENKILRSLSVLESLLGPEKMIEIINEIVVNKLYCS